MAVTNLSEEGRAELRRELAENGHWRGEVAVARKDGMTVDVELVSVALEDDEQITGYLTIHRNITERRRPSSVWWRLGRRSGAGSPVLCTMTRCRA